LVKATNPNQTSLFQRPINILSWMYPFLYPQNNGNLFQLVKLAGEWSWLIPSCI